MGRNLTEPWWKPQPMTKEQMEMEIHSTKIVPPSPQEFSDEAIHETIKELEIGDRYGKRE